MVFETETPNICYNCKGPIAEELILKLKTEKESVYCMFCGSRIEKKATRQTLQIQRDHQKSENMWENLSRLKKSTKEYEIMREKREEEKYQKLEKDLQKD